MVSLKLNRHNKTLIKEPVKFDIFNDSFFTQLSNKYFSLFKGP
jgi:hypothetical protein